MNHTHVAAQTNMQATPPIQTLQRKIVELQQSIQTQTMQLRFQQEQLQTYQQLLQEFSLAVIPPPPHATMLPPATLTTPVPHMPSDTPRPSSSIVPLELHPPPPTEQGEHLSHHTPPLDLLSLDDEMTDLDRTHTPTETRHNSPHVANPSFARTTQPTQPTQQTQPTHHTSHPHHDPLVSPIHNTTVQRGHPSSGNHGQQTGELTPKKFALSSTMLETLRHPKSARASTQEPPGPHTYLPEPTYNDIHKQLWAAITHTFTRHPGNFITEEQVLHTLQHTQSALPLPAQPTPADLRSFLTHQTVNHVPPQKRCLRVRQLEYDQKTQWIFFLPEWA
jgi:hypothetical protein